MGRHDLGCLFACDRAEFYDLGTIIGKDARGARSGSDRREVKDAHIFECSEGGHHAAISGSGGISEVLGETKAAASDDVFLDFRGTATDGVNHGVAVSRLGASLHRRVVSLDPEL